jgi:DNA-directed RNA polymerase
MDQLELNLEMVESGIARYRNKVKSAQDRGKESESAYGQRLMRGGLPNLIDEITKRIEYHRKNPHAVPVWLPLIWDMEPQTIGMLALKCTLDGICERRPLVSSSIRISSYIEDELHYRWLKAEHPSVFHYAAKDVEKDSKRSYKRKVDAFMRHERGEGKKGNMERWKTWSRRDKVAMGTWLLEVIRTTTHYIAFKVIGERQKTVMYVTATDDLFAWIQRYNADQEVLRPLWLPTVEAPREWVSAWHGGYDPDAGLPPLTLIKTFDMDYLRGLETDDMKPVIDAVNHVQSTSWMVNDRVLEVARWAWDNDREIGEMCRRSDYELPPFPPQAEHDKELKKEFSRKCGTIHHLNLSMRSQRLHIIKTLWLAEKYAGKHFYYPHQLDFRGRMYPIPYFLSPQGTDLAKSLLQFSESQTIWQPDTEARWLAIHGANQFGNDKITFDERVAWVHSKKQEIFEVCKDPIGNDWWTEADEPWQFLAFCFEWGAMLECGGRGFKTRLPVAMDASNNGIQILSLLGRDEVGGAATNVIQTDEPADLYSFVSDRVNELLLIAAKKGDHIATAWLKFGVDRKTTKRPVMVKPYGGTRYSCREYVAEWYADKCLKNELDPFGNEAMIAIGQLSKLVWKAMDECLDRPNAVMKWLQDVARILGHEGKAVEWTSPLGFHIKQKYANSKATRIRTLLGEKISFVKWQEPLNELDKIRQANGISPNFVHSLDASVAQSTANYAKQHDITSLAMVHDSFATHCNKCDRLGVLIRKSAAEIFTTDLLAGFRDEIKQQTKKELPDLPLYGSLDPLEVLGSDYFFA